MSWIAIGLGAAGAVAGGVGAMSSNKNRAKPVTLPKYSGPTPPEIGSSLRPVQTMITDTLMRRSQGQDVGFDPARREKLLENYDIDFNRAKEERNIDFQNRLSGSGQSRNLAAYDALINQANKWADDTRSKYRNAVDVEDMSRASDEKMHATDQLQNLNTFNFGQENRRSDFGLAQYGAENNAMMNNYAMQDNYAQQYQSPWASALSGAASGVGIASNVSGLMPKTTDPKNPNIGGAYGDAINMKKSGIYQRRAA